MMKFNHKCGRNIFTFHDSTITRHNAKAIESTVHKILSVNCTDHNIVVAVHKIF